MNNNKIISDTSDDKLNTENKNDTQDIKYKTKLVLSGGGIKGIAHIGCLYALDKIKCLDKITDFSGTSVGSLIMSLYVLGYTPSELYDFIKLFNLAKLKNISIMNINLFGLDTGSRIEYVIKRLIKGKTSKEDITLQELYEIKKKNMTFTTFCLNTMEVVYISHTTHPDIPLYLAIRMSISIPFIYCPVEYKGYYYVDGGIFDNYPINIFKNEINNTIGILLVDSKDVIEKINDLETYVLRVIQSMMIGMSINSKNGYENNTVEVHVESINIVNYEINEEMKDELFIKGYKSIMNQLDKIRI
ncbi:patatin-like phospholipase [Fadolivirus algeromassiliense]|jgi:predicted acylesterase/phospholipase RssA|uniref:Patatin-like phospholipase n=1 Tax=Fadolivirus FV1/VV64 TaxID=3070911 RepID=A0A7D3QVU5_9VIRU|nr:patatin-like phospholipase [Fadolivirus algeromassiliense]QKF93939.1 patatin-like phospholipase [Fadolivirus FV1/VV64]